MWILAHAVDRRQRIVDTAVACEKMVVSCGRCRVRLDRTLYVKTFGHRVLDIGEKTYPYACEQTCPETRVPRSRDSHLAVEHVRDYLAPKS